jgi:hypothetical protein
MCPHAWNGGLGSRCACTRKRDALVQRSWPELKGDPQPFYEGWGIFGAGWADTTTRWPPAHPRQMSQDPLSNNHGIHLGEQAWKIFRRIGSHKVRVGLKGKLSDVGNSKDRFWSATMRTYRQGWLDLYPTCAARNKRTASHTYQKCFVYVFIPFLGT